MSARPSKLNLTVSAGPHAREHCVLCVPLPVDAPNWSAGVVMKEVRSGEPVACQIDPADPSKLWFVLKQLRKGGATRLVVEPGQAARGSSVALSKGREKVRVEIGGKLFTEYRYRGANLARQFLYPILGPGGARLTREVRWEDGPGFDHKHHKSIWVAHGLVNGTDNWDEGGHHGSTQHVAFSEVSSGAVVGRIVEENVWLSRAGLPIMDERRVIRFYSQPAECRCMDVEITFITGHDAVLFGDTKEGGLLSVRVNPTLNAPAGTITNSFGGINEDETWGKPAQWCDYSGKADGRSVGIAVFDHPANPLYPTRWHVRNYGLMTANPFGLSYFESGSGKRGDWLLPANSEATFRYRVFIHKGCAEAAHVADRYHDYVHPPRVVIA